MKRFRIVGGTHEGIFVEVPDGTHTLAVLSGITELPDKAISIGVVFYDRVTLDLPAPLTVGTSFAFETVFALRETKNAE